MRELPVPVDLIWGKTIPGNLSPALGPNHSCIRSLSVIANAVIAPTMNNPIALISTFWTQ